MGSQIYIYMFETFHSLGQASSSVWFLTYLDHQFSLLVTTSKYRIPDPVIIIRPLHACTYSLVGFKSERKPYNYIACCCRDRRKRGEHHDNLG